MPQGLDNLRAEDDDDTRQRARDLVDTLPDDDRRLMLMRFDGYSAEEIGQALGISANSVYQRMHRITQRLKKKVNPDNHAKKQ
jgi:RNA polymerase sigma factor (sigma-70 family)